MGGRAFRSGPNPLNVVRLSTKQYIQLRDHYQRFVISYMTMSLDPADFIGSILLKFYNRAVVPPEAPEKSDHGDIDVLVDEELFNFNVQDLKQALGADAYTKGGRASSFAIRIPEDSSKYFQLDVHLCKKGCFEWENVIYAYGDLWHIIGSVVTRFGFAINDSGLHARVEESDEVNKKDCLLLLTSEPQEMMEFLGLDSPRYEKGFSTLDELFEWAISTPLFRTKFFQKETIIGKQERMREKRPMYSNFVAEWLPQKNASTATPKPGEGNDSPTDIILSAGASTSGSANLLDTEPPEERDTSLSVVDKRKDVVNKALERFSKREEYDKIMECHRERMMQDAMWRKIASELPLKGKQLGQAMMALKAHLWWNEGQPALRLGADKSMEKVPALDADMVDEVLLPWIMDHWREAVRLNEENSG